VTPHRSHFECLETSTEISAYCVPNYIRPLDVLARLDRAGVRSVLVGSHGIGGWMQEQRAARETAVLVAAGNHRKAVRALLTAFPHLRPQVHEVGTKLCDPDPQGVVINVLKAVEPILRKTLVRAVAVRARRRSYLIPSLETALALEFGPMIRLPWSDADKYMHAHDFLCILKACPDMDLKVLAACGELLYKGGGVEILEDVRRVRAGERMRLTEALFSNTDRSLNPGPP
jgi:hypothetical protein